jgi:hypothetical protein
MTDPDRKRFDDQDQKNESTIFCTRVGRFKTAIGLATLNLRRFNIDTVKVCRRCKIRHFLTSFSTVLACLAVPRCCDPS